MSWGNLTHCWLQDHLRHLWDASLLAGTWVFGNHVCGHIISVRTWHAYLSCIRAFCFGNHFVKNQFRDNSTTGVPIIDGKPAKLKHSAILLLCYLIFTESWRSGWINKAGSQTKHVTWENCSWTDVKNRIDIHKNQKTLLLLKWLMTSCAGTNICWLCNEYLYSPVNIPVCMANSYSAHTFLGRASDQTTQGINEVKSGNDLGVRNVSPQLWFLLYSFTPLKQFLWPSDIHNSCYGIPLK